MGTAGEADSRRLQLVRNQGLHNFRCTLTLLKYCGGRISAAEVPSMGAARIPRFALPVQVAAVCYRPRGSSVEFLLVNTNGGSKWTFPKGAPEAAMSHSQAAEREAWEEAGARGTIEPRHFHLYIHSKGVFWKPPGVQEFVIKAFLLQVQDMRNGHEENRNPTWFSAEEAKKILAKGREVKYGHELQTVIDRASERILSQQYPMSSTSSRSLPGYPSL